MMRPMGVTSGRGSNGARLVVAFAALAIAALGVGAYVLAHSQSDQRKTLRDRFQASLTASGYGAITTEIAAAGPFYYAEAYHQQYLDKHPNGYCGLGGTGVSCPIGLPTT